MRQPKTRKPKPQPWSTSDKINSILAGLTLIALIVSGVSTCISNQTLKLQRDQYVDSQRKDSIRSIEDSIKNAKFVELSEQQILALRQQGMALEQDVKNTQVSQSPLIDIDRLGFHFDEGFSKHFNFNDSALLTYKIMNHGIRPAILREVTLYQLNSRFKLVEKRIMSRNALLAPDKGVIETVWKGDKVGVERLKYSIDDIRRVDDFFFCFTFKFRDEYIGRNINTSNKPKMYKWVKKKDNSNWLITNEGSDSFLSFDICSDEEVRAILKSLSGQIK